MLIESNRLTHPAEGVIQVYLDSSDYSVLSKAMCDQNNPHFDVFNKLCRYVEQGMIEIRFSAVHVIEIAHLDSESKEFAVQRAKCIQRLSDGKCFRYYQEMRVIECANLICNRPIYEGVIDNNSKWYPDLSEVASSLRKILIDEFRKTASDASLNRKQRKAFEHRFFQKGCITEEGLQLLQVRREELLDALSKEFPLSERFYKEDLMLNYVAGKVSAADVIEEMEIVFRDVVRFISWTYDTRDTERKLVSWLRSYGKDLVSRVETLRAMTMDSVANSEIKADRGRLARVAIDRVIPQLRRDTLTGIRHRLKNSVQNIDVTSTRWKEVVDSDFGTIPSVDAFMMGFREYFLRNLTMNRKPKVSDAADLFHLAYLPYCDIFRADGDTAQTAKPLATEYGACIVSKLRELPKQIESMFSKREVER